MKRNAILILVGLMVLSTALYFANRILIKQDTDTSNRNHKTRKKRKNRKNPHQNDWLEKRRQAYWNDQFRHKNETDLSELTNGYIQTMILLLICIVLSLIFVP